MKKLWLLLLATMAACGGGSTEPSATVYGSYTLRSINGAQLPVNIYSDASQSLAITAGTLVLNSDKTYSLVEQEHIVISGQSSNDVYTENGTFTQSGGDLELTIVGGIGAGIHHHMVWSGNQITWTDVFINTTSNYLFTR